MGFFSNLTRSWKKSSRLSELEKAIAPPNQSVRDLISDAVRLSSGGVNQRDRALEEFLDLCESDEGIKQVMAIEHISRSDLKQLHVSLLAAGLGQWIKGHYAALSTIAYVEPLQYAVRAQKRGAPWPNVTFNLIEYWEGKIPQGGLLNRVR